MAGNTENARLWAEADVYIANTLQATVPKDAETAFSGDWGLVGLLDGEDGFTQNREEDTNDHYAWGGVLVRTSRRNFKLSLGFSALEDNAVTRQLLWPGSSAGTLIIPRPVPVLVGFEKRDGDLTHRLITKRYAIVTVDGEITDNETDLTKYPLVATIYPTAIGELFTEQSSDDE